MPRTTEQYEEIRGNRRAQIMDVALDLFSREGYAHVSIARLAKEAGISKGLMYNYFESKEALVQEILNNALTEIIDTFDPNHDDFLSKDELEAFIRAVFKMMRENMEFYIKFLSLMIQPGIRDHLRGGKIPEFYGKFLHQFHDYFEREGFEDPMLEVLDIAISIEGLGVIMMYATEMPELPKDLFDRYEERIIKKYIQR